MRKKIDSYVKGDLINGVIFLKHITYGTGREALFICTECNSEMILRVDKVRHRNLKRCSECCKAKGIKKIKKKRVFTIDTLHNRVFYKIKDGAMRRGISFNLTSDFLIKTVVLNCNYCGKKPNQQKSNRKYKLLHHGLDRIDSGIGYIESNVVSCCKTCNLGKNSLSLSQWEDHIKGLVLFVNKKNSLKAN